MVMFKLRYCYYYLYSSRTNIVIGIFIKKYSNLFSQSKKYVCLHVLFNVCANAHLNDMY